MSSDDISLRHPPYWCSLVAMRLQCKRWTCRIRSSDRLLFRRDTLNALSATPDDAILESAVSKVKRHVLPLFLVMFVANYIDRVNIGFVNAHMQADLGIGAAAYGL